MNRLPFRSALLGLSAAAALALAGCGSTPSTAPPPRPGNSAAHHYHLTILTPAQLGGTEDTGPAYVPSDFTLPANSDVTITVTNFDDATPLPAAAASFAKAQGTTGPLTIESIDPVNPNAPGKSTTATQIDPSAVSHTFTISKLGLNVPIPAKSRVTFTFHTGAAGTYAWQCFDPCGTGAAGWGGAMSAKGHMQGTVTLV